jgi:hypothetical protein
MHACMSTSANAIGKSPGPKNRTRVFLRQGHHRAGVGHAPRPVHIRSFEVHHHKRTVDLRMYMQTDPIGMEGGNNPYGYAAGRPSILTDPTGLVVKVCKRPTTERRLGNFSHAWIVTDSKAAGIGPRPGDGQEVKMCFDLLTSMRIQIANQSHEDQSDCDVVDVDEACVDRELEIGRDRGTFSLTNNCRTFVWEVINKCKRKRKPDICPMDKR